MQEIDQLKANYFVNPEGSTSLQSLLDKAKQEFMKLRERQNQAATGSQPKSERDQSAQSPGNNPLS